MANEKVVFKRGTTANLPTTKTPGTVLLDISTGAMYVDDTSSSRIQVKDPTKLGKTATAVAAKKLSNTSEIGSAINPVYFNASGVPVQTTHTLGASVPSDAKFTDTVYTHPSYTARTGVPTADQTPSFGGTFTVSQPVSDASGHITAINSRKITIPGTTMSAATAEAAGAKGLVPAPGAGKQSSFLRGDGTWATPTNTDTKVNVTLATTTKAYLLGVSTTPTSTAKALTAVSDTGVYLDTTAGKLTATSFAGSGSGLTSLNASNVSSGTLSSDRLPTVPVSKGGTGATTAKVARDNLLGDISESTTAITDTNQIVFKFADENKGVLLYKQASALWDYFKGKADDVYAAASHGTHVSFSTTVPKANGTAAVGTATTVSRSDHVHPLQTSVSGNAGTATKLKTAVNIDGFSFDGSGSINHYATCSTAAATVAKVATLNTGTLTLSTGVTVYVKFTNANTATAATLNVGGTGAKPIFHNGAALSASSYIKAGGVYQFVYDGTNWVINAGIDTNTTYTHPTTSGNKHIPSGGSTGQILKWSSDGTAIWATEYSYTHPTSAGNKHIPSGGSTGQILKYSASGTAVWADDNDTWIALEGATSSAAGTAGYAPAPPKDGYNTKYLRADGTWAVPPNTTYSVMTGATADAAGTKGLVPAPAAGKQTSFLRGDGTWVVPTNTDTKVNVTLATTTKAYLLGVSTAPTSTAKALTAISDTGVYLDTTAGKLTATSFAGSGASLTSLDASNISSGTLAAARLATSGVTAASYGPSANASPTHSGTFSVPYITVDKYGRVTAASTKTITLPSDNNTDVNVKQTLSETTNFRSILLGNLSRTNTAELLEESTGQSYVASGLYVKPSTGALFAPSLHTDSIYIKDKNDNEYRAITDNGTNLWIGASESSSTHHIGGTFISTGYDDANSEGFESVRIAVPNATNTGATSYMALHAGNYLNYKGHLRQTAVYNDANPPTDAPWYKVASIEITGAAIDNFITMHMRSPMATYREGILTARVRTDTPTVGTHGAATLNWLTSAGIDPADWVLTYTTKTNTSVTYEIWCKIETRWQSYVISVLNEGSRTNSNIVWDLAERTSVGATSYGTPTGVITSTRYIDVAPSTDVVNISTVSDKTTTLSVKSTSSQDVSLVLDRSGADWRFLNSSGTFHIQNNWVDGAQGDWFDVATFTNATKAVTFAGKVTASSFAGSGASLTSLNASNLASGTVPIARIPTGTSSTTVALGNHTHSNYYNSETSRTANTVLAAPNGSAGSATFRKLVAADLPTSGATAASYGPSANATPTHGGTFSVPYVTVDKYGRITAASTKTITLPASGNTDTKVNVTLATKTKAYILGVSTTPTSTAQALSAVSDTGVYLDTTAGRLTATSFEAPGSTRSVVVTGAGIRNVTPADEGWAMGTTWYTPDASAVIASIGVYGKSNAASSDDIHYMYMGPNYDDAWFKISPTLATFTKDVTILKETPTLTLNANSNTNVSIVLKRTNSSWQILNASGEFVIQGNYKNGSVGDWYNAFKFSASGNATFTGKVTAPEFIGDLTGNADSATKVYSTLTEASTGTSYAIPFHSSATSGNKSLLNNAGFRLNMLNGTADTTATDGTVTKGTVGHASLYLGNATASGAAGNKFGRILLYGSNSNYVYITGNVDFTANRTLTIPDASGTIALTNDANKYNYGTCSTAADTVAKVVTCSGFTSLATGAEIVVKFSNTNTAANPTLNVNSTGAKPIYYDGSAITAASAGKLYAGGYYTFRYNGTQWCVVASSPTYIYTTFTEPTSSTTYNLAFVNSSTTSTYKSLRINDGVKCYVNEGTTTTDGYSVIQLGNSTASGTEGNKSGYLRLYNNAGSYTIFRPGEATSNVTITLPETTGTVALTNQLNKVTQGATTSANYRPLLMGYTNDSNINDLEVSTTNTAFVINGLAVKPSVGELHVPGPLMIHGKKIPYTADGLAGYYCIAQFVINATHTSNTIEIVVGDRNTAQFTTFYLRFSHVNSKDPTINGFTYIGAAKTAYICKSATSTWQLWVNSTSTYHTMSIMSIKSSSKNNLSITYPGTYMSADDFETAIATGGSLETNTAASLGSGYRVAAANQWVTTRNINGMAINGTSNRVNYGSCSTAAATAAKTVACSGFALVTGAEITVKFTVTNSAASPTLNVNSTGAKPIYIDGAAITADTASVLASGHTFTFRYNGTQYEIVDTKYNYHVLTNPTSSAEYNIPFITNGTSSLWKQSRLNNGLRYTSREGTTATDGDGIARLILGNGVASETAGNKTGSIRIYGDKTYYGTLTPASGMTASRTWTLPNATGTIALTSQTSNVKQTDLECSPTNNYGLRLPILLASTTANSDNSFVNDETQREINATTVTAGVNMTGLAWVETNYYTTAGEAGQAYATICANAFKVVGTSGTFQGDLYGNANTATRLENNPKINGVEFSGYGDISLGEVIYEGTGDVSSVTLTESATNFDALWVETSLGGYMVSSATNYYFYTYATTPYPAQGGMTSSTIGTVCIHVADTSLSSNVSNIKITGSSSSVTSASSTNTNFITKVIGLHLV